MAVYPSDAPLPKFKVNRVHGMLQPWIVNGITYYQINLNFECEIANFEEWANCGIRIVNTQILGHVNGISRLPLTLLFPFSDSILPMGKWFIMEVLKLFFMRGILGDGIVFLSKLGITTRIL